MNFQRDFPTNAAIPSSMSFSLPLYSTNWPSYLNPTNYPMTSPGGFPQFNWGYHQSTGLINCSTSMRDPWILSQQACGLLSSRSSPNKYSSNFFHSTGRSSNTPFQNPDIPLDLTKKSLVSVMNTAPKWNLDSQPLLPGNPHLLQQYFLQLYQQSGMSFSTRSAPLPLVHPSEQVSPGGVTKPSSSWPYIGHRIPSSFYSRYRQQNSVPLPSPLSSAQKPLDGPGIAQQHQHQSCPRSLDKQSRVATWLNQEAVQEVVDTSPGSLGVGGGGKARVLHQRRNCGGGGKQPVTRCFQCSKLFPSLIDLNEHFLQEHESALMHEFELARSWKSLAVEDMCMQDLETVIRRGDTETTGYQCPHCDYFAKWPTELQKHIMVHSKERPHQCIICGLTYKWKWDLGRHFDKSHGHAANPYKKSTGEPADPRSNGTTVGSDQSSSLHKADRPGGAAAINTVPGSGLLGGGGRGQRKRRLVGPNVGGDRKQRRSTIMKHLSPIHSLSPNIPITLPTPQMLSTSPELNPSQLQSIHLDDLLKPVNNFFPSVSSHRMKLHNGPLRRQRFPIDGSSSLRCCKPFSCKFCPYQSKLKTNVIRHIRKCPRIKRANISGSHKFSRTLSLDHISDAILEDQDIHQKSFDNLEEEIQIKCESPESN